MNKKGDIVEIKTKRYGIEGTAKLINKIRDFQYRERWEIQFIRENRIFKRTIDK